MHVVASGEPRISLASAVATLTAVRKAVGDAPVLGTDFHHQYTPAEVASALQKMPPGTLDWLEEGIRDESIEAYEVLRTLTPVPFAIGEEFASKWQFLPFIEKGLTNFARVDICNVGVSHHQQQPHQLSLTGGAGRASPRR